jgi:hypothetical protein
MPAEGARSTSRADAALVYVLAGCGVFLVGWGLWTWIAWAASGPKPITAGRDPGSASWWAARILEWTMIAIAIPTSIVVVRGCLRERRITFDAWLCIAFFLCLWQDPVVDWFEPVLLFSTNFVNLSTWCNHMPVSFNPVCERIPEPLLFEVPFYLFNFVAMLMGFNAAMRAIKRKWPGVTSLQMALVSYVAAQTLNVTAFALPVHYYLWSFPTLPWSIFSGNVRYPLVDSIAFSSFFAAMAWMRFYRQETGTTFIEKRLEALPRNRRKLMGVLALNGYVQLWFLLVSGYDIVAAALSERPLPELPAHLMGAVCETREWERCP